MDPNKKAVAIFNKRADAYQDKFMDVSSYSDSFDLFCDQIPANADILEIACGPGNITKYLLNKRPDLRIFGIDLAPNMIELARINNPTAHFEIMDCRNIGSVQEKYNAIMCGFCLPYLSKQEAEELIRSAANILDPKGVLYLSMIEGDHSRSGISLSSYGDEGYMYYHEAGHISDTLKENGFQIIELLRKDAVEKDGTQRTDLLILAKK